MKWSQNMTFDFIMTITSMIIKEVISMNLNQDQLLISYKNLPMQSCIKPAAK